MNFDMYMPARVISGEDCVLKNSSKLRAKNVNVVAE